MGQSVLKIKIIHEQCDPDLAKDTSLPYTAYLIGYESGTGIQYDIAVASKKVDIFDHYWDKYRSVVSMKQTDGKINPKLWNDPRKKKK